MVQHPKFSFPLPRVSGLFRAALVAALLNVLPLTAQEQSPVSPTPPVVASLEMPTNAESDPGVETPAPVQPQFVPKNDRLFFVMPNYSTVENSERFRSSQLSAKSKFKLSAKTMSDPVTISFLGTLALLGQARNTDPSYGQEVQGYAKRFGKLYADSGIGTLMTTSVFPTLLHQDPRYYQSGAGGKWHRLLYAASQIFVTRSDSGEPQFNYSEIVGNAVAAGISNTYRPQGQRTLVNTLNVWRTDILLNTLCNVAKEFWPDLRRKLRKQELSE